MTTQSTAAPITVSDPVAAVQEWFARLGQCCAEIDYTSARVLFAEDVVSFGTKAKIVSGLDPLHSMIKFYKRKFGSIANVVKKADVHVCKRQFTQLSAYYHFKAVYRGDRFKFKLESQRDLTFEAANTPRISMVLAWS